MFCPEDGVELKVQKSNVETVVYETCPKCGSHWAYCAGSYKSDGDDLLPLMEVVSYD